MFLLKHHSELPSDILIKIESKYTRWFSQLSQEAEQEMHDARRPKELALPLLGSFDAVLHLNILDYDLPEIYGYLLAMFKKLKVMDILKVTPSQMLDFLIDVQERYQDTPYHSFRHGCDVLMMLYSNYMELMRNRAVEGEFDFIMELEIAVIFIAAICHDAGHNGRNNDFHERTKSPLTTRFEKNTSYLEALSVDITLELIEKHRLFHAFTSMEEQCMIHEWIETAILLTDMKHHHDLLKMAKILRDMFDHANVHLEPTHTPTDDDKQSTQQKQQQERPPPPLQKEEDDDPVFNDHEFLKDKNLATELLSAMVVSVMETEPLPTAQDEQSSIHSSCTQQQLIFSLDEDYATSPHPSPTSSTVTTTTTTTTSVISSSKSSHSTSTTVNSLPEGIFITPPSSVPLVSSPSPLEDLAQQSSQSSRPPPPSFKLSPKQRLALACVLLHAADISNPIRPWRISKQWSDLVVQEFYAQGDDEREAGFPKISPGMDRMQNTQASTGVRFNNIVKEYFEQVAAILALPSLSSHYNDIDDTQDDPTTTTTKGVSDNILLDTLNANTLQWQELSQCSTNVTTKDRGDGVLKQNVTMQFVSREDLKHRKMMSLPAGTLSIPSNSNHRKNEPKIRPLPIVRTTSHSSFLFSPPLALSDTTTANNTTTITTTTTTTIHTSTLLKPKRHHLHIQHSPLRRNSSDVVS